MQSSEIDKNMSIEVFKLSSSPTIGITGGIGAGKSVISRILRINGFEVYDCDSEAKKLMEQDNEVKEELIKKFGDNIYDESGKLNRKFLADIIFNDKSARDKVNSIVHKAVYKDIQNKRKKENRPFFIESAILGSSGLIDLCDFTLNIMASEESRLNRVISRDNLCDKDIKQRMDSQNRELDFIPPEKRIDILNDSNHPILKKIIDLIKK